MPKAARVLGYTLLHINGGGTAREDTQREYLDAIAFALEGDPSEYDSDTQAIALEVSVGSCRSAGSSAAASSLLRSSPTRADGADRQGHAAQPEPLRQLL